MFSFTKKISSVFKQADKAFEEADKAFKEADELFDQLDDEPEAKAPAPGTEHETVVEETRPDGTRIVTKTVIRRTGPSPK